VQRNCMSLSICKYVIALMLRTEQQFSREVGTNVIGDTEDDVGKIGRRLPSFSVFLGKPGW